MKACTFSSLPCFGLRFTEAVSLKGCIFENTDGRRCPMTKPPVVIGGLRYPVIAMDRHIKIGSHAMPAQDWLSLSASETGNLLGLEGIAFLNSHMPLIRHLLNSTENC